MSGTVAQARTKCHAQICLETNIDIVHCTIAQQLLPQITTLVKLRHALSEYWGASIGFPTAREMAMKRVQTRSPASLPIPAAFTIELPGRLASDRRLSELLGCPLAS